MMDIDVRTVFENWMEKAYQLETAKSYSFAYNRYNDAYQLASLAEDSAKLRAYQGMQRCKNKIEEKDKGLAK